VRILLCDDHRLLIEAFDAVLTAHGHEVVALATTPDEASRAAAALEPDVCVLDLVFPDGSGLDAAAAITSTTSCKVLVLSGRSDPALVKAALAAGASGFVPKDHSVEGVLRALDRLSAGEVALDRDLLNAVVRAPSGRCAASDQLRFLTRREREALRRIADGQSTKEIAHDMHVAHSTARTHVQNVLTKLGVRSRLQAAALVARAGLADELNELPPAAGSDVR
jgi:two-component system nitrate/nitrite response regulator NarL